MGLRHRARLSRGSDLRDTDEHGAVLDLDGIASEVAIGGRSQTLAGRDMELGLVQRALDGIALDETRGQDGILVRAYIV
jgi:hypothetical protein